jgi:hypothetical protein
MVQPCEITEPYDSGQALNHQIAHFHDFTWFAALNHQKRGLLLNHQKAISHGLVHH